METAAFAESFALIVQCEKREIHPVFPLFPHFPLGQNLSAKALAPLCGIALTNEKGTTPISPIAVMPFEPLNCHIFPLNSQIIPHTT